MARPPISDFRSDFRWAHLRPPNSTAGSMNGIAEAGYVRNNGGSSADG